MFPISIFRFIQMLFSLLWGRFFFALSSSCACAVAHLASPHRSSVPISCSSQTANELGHKTCAGRKFITGLHAKNISDRDYFFIFKATHVSTGVPSLHVIGFFYPLRCPCGRTSVVLLLTVLPWFGVSQEDPTSC